ncbi:PRC and DUF2382 domain-containing protein [Blastococcus montanus]|uniref:PRC and DUF2382 domain-containing protein n=1 Tax=Blastococcus montanus TaxID=3144973 RepID=UPI00320B3D35
MLSEREVSDAIGATAYGADGDKLGTVDHFFVDDRTGEPTWVAVTTGLFGTRHSVAPAREATWADGTLRLPVSIDAVKTAPPMDGNHLDPGEEAELRRHYGLESTDTARTGAADTAPPTAADAGTDGTMIRSEERLRISTEQVAARRVRLVKYVVTEEVTMTVPIRREEIRLEEVPMDDADEGTGSVTGESLVTGDTAPSAAAGMPDEIILHTERPVVSVEVVPVERVRLRSEFVQGQETVTEQVQREQIVVDEDGAARD